MLSDHGGLVATYALCGFASFSSIAIQIGGLAPDRRQHAHASACFGTTKWGGRRAAPPPFNRPLRLP